VAVLGLALIAGGAWQALIILVLLAAALHADEIAGAAAKAVSAVLGAARERARQRRELDIKRLELQAALTLREQPVPCPHQDPKDVRDLSGNLVARLCTGCGDQLPPDFQAPGEAAAPGRGAASPEAAR
jgi:hypothetical protein